MFAQLKLDKSRKTSGPFKIFLLLIISVFYFIILRCEDLPLESVFHGTASQYTSHPNPRKNDVRYDFLEFGPQMHLISSIEVMIFNFNYDYIFKLLHVFLWET